MSYDRVAGAVIKPSKNSLDYRTGGPATAFYGV